MMRVIIRAAVDKPKSKRTVHGTAGVKRTVHLPQRPPDRRHRIRGPAGSLFAPVRGPPRAVMRMRLGGPPAGPVGVHDSEPLNITRRIERWRRRGPAMGQAAVRMVEIHLETDEIGGIQRVGRTLAHWACDVMERMKLRATAAHHRCLATYPYHLTAM